MSGWFTASSGDRPANTGATLHKALHYNKGHVISQVTSQPILVLGSSGLETDAYSTSRDPRHSTSMFCPSFALLSPRIIINWEIHGLLFWKKSPPGKGSVYLSDVFTSASQLRLSASFRYLANVEVSYNKCRDFPQICAQTHRHAYRRLLVELKIKKFINIFSETSIWFLIFKWPKILCLFCSLIKPVVRRVVRR